MGRRTDNKDKKRKWGRLGRDPGIVFSGHEAIYGARTASLRLRYTLSCLLTGFSGYSKIHEQIVNHAEP